MVDGSQIFSCALTVLYFILATSFIGHALFHYCRQDDEQKKRQTDKVTVILCIFALLSMSVCMSLCILVSFGFAIFTEITDLFIVFFTARVVFHIGTTFVHLLFLNTVHVTFGNSSYDYPLWTKVMLLVFICIVLMFFIVYNYLIFFVNFEYESYRSLIYLPSEYIVNIALLVMFNRNLLLVAKSTFQSSDEESIENSKTQRLMDVVVRNTVLFGMIALVAIVEITLSLVGSPIVNANIDRTTFDAMYWIIQLCYCFSIGICVYLKMSFSTNAYFKICKYPHLCCRQGAYKVARKLWSEQSPKDFSMVSVDTATRSANDGDTSGS